MTNQQTNRITLIKCYLKDNNEELLAERLNVVSISPSIRQFFDTVVTDLF